MWTDLWRKGQYPGLAKRESPYQPLAVEGEESKWLLEVQSCREAFWPGTEAFHRKTANVNLIPGRKDAGGIYTVPPFSVHCMRSWLPPTWAPSWHSPYRPENRAENEPGRPKRMFVIIVLLTIKAIYLALTMWIIGLSILFNYPLNIERQGIVYRLETLRLQEVK